MSQQSSGEASPADRTPTGTPADSAAGAELLPLNAAAPEFTLRAILTGMALGGLLSICNVYIGLKIGFALNMSITAALVGYGLWAGLRRLVPRRIEPLGILENNINQTACSSGAAIASAGLVAPIPALTLLTGQTLPWHWLALWVFSVCLVGIAVAVPLRRQMLIREKLPFAPGIASAETLREMHTRGAEALARVKVLASFGLLGSAASLIGEYVLVGKYARYKLLALPGAVRGFTLKSLTFGISPTLLVLPAIGALIGLRACVSLLVGSVFSLGLLAPPLVESGIIQLEVTRTLSDLPAGVTIPAPLARRVEWIPQEGLLRAKGILSDTDAGLLRSLSQDAGFQAAADELVAKSRATSQNVTFAAMRNWLLWPGMTLMVVASLTSLALSSRSMWAAIIRRAGPVEGVARSHCAEVTRRWFVIGLGVALLLSVVLQMTLFEIVWWAAVSGVLLSFGLALVAARVAGETAITPVGAMGKVTQFIFGAAIPENPAPNLMAANVAGGAASQCADLLHDLKCGHLLGASPRSQSVAQICGAAAGAVVGSAAYLLLIPDPQKQLLTPEWPAAGVAVWKGVAELFKAGVGGLPDGVPQAMLVAAAAGLVLTVVERALPRRLRPFTLSPASLGLAFVIPAHYALSMFLGGAIAVVVSKASPRWSKRFLVAACAGVVAGESITGVGICFHRFLIS